MKQTLFIFQTFHDTINKKADGFKIGGEKLCQRKD
jgi:hypothetical protein